MSEICKETIVPTFFSAVCPPGYYSNSSSVCKPCEKGFYKTANGTENCTPCSANLTTSSEGSIAESNCSIGTLINELFYFFILDLFFYLLH